VTSSPSGYTTTGTRASLGSRSSDILLTDKSLVNRDALMEEYVRLMQNMLRSTSTIKKRAKSVYQSKNLGTIKNRKREKQQTTKEDSNGEIILRILRMRYPSLAPRLKFTSIGLIQSDRNGTSDFIVQQLRTLSKLQAEQEAREKAKEQRKLNRPRQDGQSGGIPPVPSIPPVPPVPSK
jgi:hypothetical protein